MLRVVRAMSAKKLKLYVLGLVLCTGIRDGKIGVQDSNKII